MHISISQCNGETIVDGFPMRKHSKEVVYEALRIAADAIKDAQKDLYLRWCEEGKQ